MKKLKVLDLFSGIGGFSLGLERTGGFETVAFCEIEEFPRKVLKKHWPNVPIYEDVRNVTAEQLRADGISVDVITGGFPCQDISVAGKQAGIGDGTRSGLWSECARLLGELRPRYALFENVTALLSGERGDWFKRVLWDISQVGFDAEWHCIPASELGAHHHRDRVWIICYPQHDGLPTTKIREGNKKRNGSDEEGSEPASEFKGPSNSEILANSKSKQDWGLQQSEFQPYTGAGGKDVADANSQGLQRGAESRVFREGRQGWVELITRCFCGFDDISQIEPTVCRGSDGIPDYAHRLKGLGNAVVPQIPELIGRAILQAEETT